MAAMTRLWCLAVILAGLPIQGQAVIIEVARDPYDPEAIQWIKDTTSAVVGNLDLAFIVDNTGSMSGQIGATKTYLLSIVESLEASPLAKAGKLRIAVVAYRDHSDDKLVWQQDFTSDTQLAKAFVDGMGASGGGDTPEAVGAAFQSAAKLSWGVGHARTAVLIADAPPHLEGARQPEWPRWEDGLEALKEMGVTVHSLLWSSSLSVAQIFQRFATETGGMFQILTSDAIIGPISVCAGEAQLDSLYLASRGLAIVKNTATELQALSSDQLRVQHLWGSMQAAKLRKMDVSVASGGTLAFEMRYRDLDFEDVIDITRIMVEQPTVSPCTEYGCFCGMPLEPQIPRGLLPIQVVEEAKQLTSSSFRLPTTPFHLDSVDVKAYVTGSIAEVTMVQAFTNQATKDGNQAEYVFPLPGLAAVFHFEADIDGRRLMGVVKERAAAKKAYDEAVSQGKTALLLSTSDDKTEGLFQVALGNIAPGAKVLITVKYVMELEQAATANRLLFNVPTSVVPPFRVAPPAFTAGSSPETNRPAGGYAMTASVTVLGARSVSSPSHGQLLVLGSGPQNETVGTVKPGQLLQDIVFALDFDALPNAVLESWSDSRPKEVPEHALFMRLAPNLPGALAASPKLEIIMDRSSSMARSSAVEQSVKVAEKVIEQLQAFLNSESGAPATLPFRITIMDKAITSTAALSLAKGGQGSWRSVVGEQKKWETHADGGTYLADALGKAIAAEATEVIFISDGLVAQLGVLEDVLRLSSIRFHGVGVGAFPRRQAMRRLAAVTGGTAHFVTPGDMQWTGAGKLAATVMRVSTQAAAPVLKSAGGSQLAVVQFVPAKLGGNLDGSPIPTTAFFDAAGVENYTSGRAQLSSYSFDIALAAPQRSNGSAVHRAAARRAVETLEAEEARLTSRLATYSKGADAASKTMAAQLGKQINDTVAEVVRLGLNYSLVTSHTSLLIVDESTPPPTPAPQQQGSGSGGSSGSAGKAAASPMAASPSPGSPGGAAEMATGDYASRSGGGGSGGSGDHAEAAHSTSGSTGPWSKPLLAAAVVAATLAGHLFNA